MPKSITAGCINSRGTQVTIIKMWFKQDVNRVRDVTVGINPYSFIVFKYSSLILVALFKSIFRSPTIILIYPLNL